MALCLVALVMATMHQAEADMNVANAVKSPTGSRSCRSMIVGHCFQSLALAINRCNQHMA